jgi:hypothetical protein
MTLAGDTKANSMTWFAVCDLLFARCLAAHLAAASQPYRNRSPTLPLPYRKYAEIS